MIIDHISHLNLYNIPSRKEIARFLATVDITGPFVPEAEIKGRELFLRSSTGMTRDPKEGRFEIHRDYIDLQYVLKGREVMETAPTEELAMATEYDGQKDYQFFTAEKDITRHLIRAGEFAVFFPGEAHRPLCSPDEGPNEVKKLIFKIKAVA